MSKKHIALGTKVKLATGDAGAMEDQDSLSAVTPPSRSHAEIEATALEDELEVPLLGIEEASRPQFVQFWEPNDTLHEKIDELFESKDIVAMELVSPHEVPVTDEFNVKVQSLEKAELTPDGVYQRTVTFIRTGDITRSV